MKPIALLILVIVMAFLMLFVTAGLIGFDAIRAAYKSSPFFKNKE